MRSGIVVGEMRPPASPRPQIGRGVARKFKVRRDLAFGPVFGHYGVQAYYADDTHWNADGHRVAAEASADCVRR